MFRGEEKSQRKFGKTGKENDRFIKCAIDNIDSSVRIEISDVDRGKDDPSTIFAIVLKLTDDGFYQLVGCNGSKINEKKNTSYFLFFTSYLFDTYLHTWYDYTSVETTILSIIVYNTFKQFVSSRSCSE